MTTPPDTTQTIHRAGCVIHIIGLRSRKGWKVTRHDGDAVKLQGERKTKDKAIQLATDACEPGVATTFHVQPITDS